MEWLGAVDSCISMVHLDHVTSSCQTLWRGGLFFLCMFPKFGVVHFDEITEAVICRNESYPCSLGSILLRCYQFFTNLKIKIYTRIFSWHCWASSLVSFEALSLSRCCVQPFPVFNLLFAIWRVRLICSLPTSDHSCMWNCFYLTSRDEGVSISTWEGFWFLCQIWSSVATLWMPKTMYRATM